MIIEACIIWRDICMPRKGYQAITISEHVYNLVKEHIEAENKKENYKKWRSISQFVETALMEYLKRTEK